MIKGCNKRVLVMKETGVDMIEEAIFIIRSDAKTVHSGFDGDIIRQANMILDSGAEPLFASMPKRERGERRFHLKSFALGALTVSAVFLVCVFAI